MSRHAWFITGAVLMSATLGGQAEAEEPPLCTNRPTKSNSVCTVPKGYWQVEMDLFNYSHDRNGGVTTNTTTAPNPTLKYGLDDVSDIEVNFAPHTSVKSDHHRQNSVGDLYVYYKRQLTDADARFRVGLLPYVKIPTARGGIGNERFEGGMAIPINIYLPYELTLTFSPQVDALVDSDGNGHHVNMANVINLAKALTPTVSVIGELWMDNNFDPHGTYTQTSADFATTFLVTPTIQLDVGTNIGLNDHTPDYQVYTGFSTRF